MVSGFAGRAAAAAALAGLLVRMRRELAVQGRLSAATVGWMYATYTAHAAATTVALARPRGTHRVPKTVIAAGSAMAVAGAGLTVTGMSRFQGPAQVSALRRGELVISGIYRVSRNPQYAGYVLLLAGLALARGSAAAGVLAGSAAAAFRWWVPVEEAHLEREFGDAYRGYRDRTARWLGRPRWARW